MVQIANAMSQAKSPRSLYLYYASSFAAVAILAITASGGLVTYFAFTASAKTAVENQQLRANAIKERVSEHLTNIERYSRNVLALPWDQNAISNRQMLAELRRLIALVQPARSAFLIRADGSWGPVVSRTTFDSLEMTERTPLPTSLLVSLKGRTLYSNVYSGSNNEPVALLIFLSSSTTPTLIGLEVDMRTIVGFTRQLRYEQSGIAYVEDNTGALIVHPDMSKLLVQARTQASDEVMLRSLLLSASLNKAVSNNPNSYSTPSLRDVLGNRTIRATMPLDHSGWRIVVEQLSEEIFSPLRTLIFLLLIVTAASIVLSFLVSHFFSRRLVSPIRRFAVSAAQIGKGDFSNRLNTKLSGELGLLQDEFNNMAAQLEDYTKRLEQKVAEKTVELERANQHKSEFLANMSHELRTPLNAVIGFSDALTEEYFGSLNDKQKEYVRDINTSGQHLLSLINDILDLSKIEAGKMELELSAFSAEAAVGNALTLIRERALRQNLQLSAEIAADVGLIHADERKFKQILINLLTNAVKFTHPGGWVRVTMRRDKNKVLVTVEDNGIGIASEDQATVFEEFRQLHATGSTKHEGTGLGLAVVRRLVTLHGGEVSLTSTVGEGARFTFTLPQTRP
jgi:signal transduction histidine kinase